MCLNTWCPAGAVWKIGVFMSAFLLQGVGDWLDLEFWSSGLTSCGFSASDNKCNAASCSVSLPPGLPPPRWGPSFTPAIHLCLATFLPWTKPVSCQLFKSHTEAYLSSEHPKQVPHATQVALTPAQCLPHFPLPKGTLACAHRLGNVQLPVCPSSLGAASRHSSN